MSDRFSEMAIYRLSISRFKGCLFCLKGNYKPSDFQSEGLLDLLINFRGEYAAPVTTGAVPPIYNISI